MRSACAAIATLLGLALSGQAAAVAIDGHSGGVFSKLTDCDKSGSDRECGIVNSGNGTKTQVRWPYLEDHDEISYASTLTAVDRAIHTATSANDIVIAQLDWFNAATSGRDTPDNLGVTWTLSISFTSPNVSLDSEAFKLSIANTDNPSPDRMGGFALTSLSNLAFHLNDWTISDFRYAVVDGAGTCSGTDTSLVGSVWYNCEDNLASLLITADFASLAVPTTGDDSNPVHEPATLAILATGLLGIAALRRRKTA